jgi:hypothetical protein
LRTTAFSVSAYVAIEALQPATIPEELSRTRQQFHQCQQEAADVQIGRGDFTSSSR